MSELLVLFETDVHAQLNNLVTTRATDIMSKGTVLAPADTSTL